MALNTDTEPGGKSPQQLLDEWLDDVPGCVDRLRDVLLPEGFPLDFSAESLDVLEDCLLDFYHPLREVEEGTGFVEAAMAYLGEVLLFVAGGNWGWNTRPLEGFDGQPVVCPDPDLGERPVAPLLLISYALRVRSGNAFAQEVERLRSAMATLQEEAPGWEPSRALTPGVDAQVPESIQWPDWKLDAWKNGMPETLDALRSSHLDPAFPFDYTPASLVPLESVILANWRAGEDFDAESELLTAAMMYVGEVLLRTVGGSWGWGADIDQPVICPDPDLGLLPLAPFHLIHHAVQDRSGEAFTVMDDHLREAVRAHQQGHPGWEPTREPVPGVGPESA
ncbi:hypothetical protein [Streptomyces sp. NPDC002851]